MGGRHHIAGGIGPRQREPFGRVPDAVDRVAGAAYVPLRLVVVVGMHVAARLPRERKILICADPGVLHAQRREDPPPQVIGVGAPSLAFDDEAGQDVAGVRVLHAVPRLLADAVGEGEFDDFRAGPPLVGDHRHGCLEIRQAAAVIEENADRHFPRLGNLGKPSRDGFVEIDLAVLDQKMKARRDEGLCAARDPEEMIRRASASS